MGYLLGKRLLSWGMALVFLSQSVLPASAQPVPLDAGASAAVRTLAPSVQPMVLKGIRFYKDAPLKFDFIVNPGSKSVPADSLAFGREFNNLMHYFLASLTIAEKDKWVNLKPGEKDRIIAENFGKTKMGEDLLLQDYVLKQLSASLTHPEKALGETFWKRVYEQAQARFGSTEIPADVYNRVWIMPDTATIMEEGQTVYVVSSRLKVLTEADFLKTSLAGESAEPLPEQSRLMEEILRDVIVPELEREVNEGAAFASLRQIYSAVILASWFKNNFKQSVLGQAFVDRNKLGGIQIPDQEAAVKIYDQYLEALKAGVYNFVKEEKDATGEIVPRHFFSGGVVLTAVEAIVRSFEEALLKDPKQITSAEIVEWLEASRSIYELEAGQSVVTQKIRDYLAGVPRAVLRKALETFSAPAKPGEVRVTLNIVNEIGEAFHAGKSFQVYSEENFKTPIEGGHKILTVNAGSSSLKFALIREGHAGEFMEVEGNYTDIGTNKDGSAKSSVLKLKIKGEKIEIQSPAANHVQALQVALNILKERNIIQSFDEVEAVAHRVVHGADSFSDAVAINDDVIAAIQKATPLAPLHNPANLDCIRAAQEVLQKARHVAVFDTAFHATITDGEKRYAIPRKIHVNGQDVSLDEVHGYGFHGTSYKYILGRMQKILRKETPNLIIAHLGNGASITAIKEGKSVSTSMGFTPLDGLMMGTRSGRIDPGVISYIMKKTGLSVEQVTDVLNKKSGLQGVSESSNEMHVLKALAETDLESADLTDAQREAVRNARKAIDLFVTRLLEFIGADMVKLGGRNDALVLTAGMGENEWWLALEVAKRIEGIYAREFPVMVVPTNEEIVFAREGYKFLAPQEAAERAMNQLENQQTFGGIYLGDEELEKRVLKNGAGIELAFDPLAFESIASGTGVGYEVIGIVPIPSAVNVLP